MEPMTMMMMGQAAQDKALNFGKTLLGGWQSLRAAKGLNKLRQNRPVYETPASATQALGLSRQMAYGDMPGRGYAEQRMERGTAAGIRNVQRSAPSSAAALGATTDIYSRQMDAERDMAYQAAMYKQQAMQNYQGQLGQMANYEDQAFNINQWMPYQTEMNRLYELQQTGQANMWGGMQGQAQTNANVAGTQAQMQAMQSMYGNQGGQGAVTGQPPPPPSPPRIMGR